MPISTTVPERTRQQRLDALAKANPRRTARAKLKRLVKADPDWLVLTEVLQDLSFPAGIEPAELEGMRVIDLLLAAPVLGPVKVSKLMSEIRISHRKTLVGLSERQRAVLVDRLNVMRQRRACARLRPSKTING